MFFKRASGEIHSAFEFHITLGWVFTDQLFFYWDQLFIIGISSLLLGSALYCWDQLFIVGILYELSLSILNLYETNL